MPYADSDGVRLYFEETGKGAPIVFVHEFADDLRSWEPQLRFFSRRYRCIAYNARGYPPSDVPAARAKYSQAIAADDIANVMRHLGVKKAHVIGCSMGGYATVHFGLRYPKMAVSLTAVGVGYGSDPDKREQFLSDTEVMAKRFDELGTAEAVKPYQVGPARVQFQNKDPRGFAQSSPSTRRSARRTPYAACRRSARRSTRSSAPWPGCACRCTWSAATKTTTASSLRFSSNARALRRGCR
jgi:pimeloyl-ACP methyl ester carboxylesterase